MEEIRRTSWNGESTPVLTRFCARQVVVWDFCFPSTKFWFCQHQLGKSRTLNLLQPPVIVHLVSGVEVKAGAMALWLLMEHHLEYPRMCKAWTKVEQTGNLSWLCSYIFSINTHVIQIVEAQIMWLVRCLKTSWISWVQYFSLIISSHGPCLTVAPNPCPANTPNQWQHDPHQHPWFRTCPSWCKCWKSLAGKTSNIMVNWTITWLKMVQFHIPSLAPIHAMYTCKGFSKRKKTHLKH